MSNITRTSLDALSQANFPNNTSQQISPADLRDWIESAVDSFVTQKDKSTFENAFYECKSSDITVSGIGSCNLVLATGNFVHIKSSGPATINSFGSLPAGSRFILNFEVPVTIQYNATSLIIPGAADIITAAGDSIMIVSEGSGNWRVIGFFPGSGLPVGTVTAVTASSPLSATPGNAPNISIPQATGVVDGYLSSTDWTTFNNKQPAGSYITALTGDVTASGPGSVSSAIANDAVTFGKMQNVNTGILLGRGTAGTGDIEPITLGTNLSLSGTTLNATGGGTPGGADTEVQYNNGGAFGGVTDLTYEGTPTPFVVIKNPKIGSSIGNGHLHIHTINATPPSGIADYVTLYVDKSPKQIGARFETDGYTSAFQFGATTDRTYTFPDDSGNVVLDTNSQTLSNKTLSTPTIDGIATIGNGTSAGEIRLLEPSGSGTDYVAIKGRAIATGSSYSLTLPATQGGSGQVIVNDGSGQLSWANNGGATTGKFLGTVAASTVTGTTAETLLSELLIPANTFTAGDCFSVLFRSRRLNTGSLGDRWNFYISNASGVFSGKPLIGFFSIPVVSQSGFSAERNITIYNATTTFYVNSPASRYDDFNNDNLSSTNIDWTVPQYVIMTCIPISGQTIYNISTHISPR